MPRDPETNQGKMSGEQFVEFADGMISDMRQGLPKIGRDFYREKGRGAILMEFHDAPLPKDRKMHIGYLKPEDLLEHQYLRQLVDQYDPDSELVLMMTSTEGYAYPKHLTFTELA